MKLDASHCYVKLTLLAYPVAYFDVSFRSILVFPTWAVTEDAAWSETVGKMKYYTLEEFMRMWVRKHLKFNYKYNYLYK